MNNALIEVESTLTDRYQTTVPETVRKALHLGKRDKIQYTIKKNGCVLISRAEPKQEDSVMNSFLAFIAQDMQCNPQNIMFLNNALQKRIQTLVSGVTFDLDEPLRDEDE